MTFEPATAVFVVNLVQDVNVLRPLIFMAARDFEFEVLILVASKMKGRDLFGIWRAELDAISSETGARLDYFDSDWSAFRKLSGRGVIFAGSESSVPGHAVTHDLFRYAPPGFLTITLQHGFECVGFRHSAAHDASYGHRVSFTADILCAWQSPELQESMAVSQRSKVSVTGPTSVLQSFTDSFDRNPNAAGIVCENLHSVRMSSNSARKTEFVDTFNEFCRLLARERKEVVLRPHPGGQYVLKNKIQLPANATINNAPMYRVDLRRFSYGISAPSSVLIDMLLAGIPTAVWRDRQGCIDVDNYTGLTSVSTEQEWIEFAREATLRPEPFLERQREFLEGQRMPIDPADVYDRFARIFESVLRMEVPRRTAAVPHRRLLFIANAHLPTLQICLERPLSALVNSGDVVTELMTEIMLKEQEAKLGSSALVKQWIDRKLTELAPDTLIFCRYSGPYASEIVRWACQNDVPIVYHIDDDLLAVPLSLGERKHAYHNAPERLSTVRTLLTQSDVVYASTELLRQRLLGYYPDAPVVAGLINCSGRIIRTPLKTPGRVLGYMGFDHLADLMMVLPAIVSLLDRHPHVSFELFGPMPIPEELQRFGDRVRSLPTIRNYESFLKALAERRWDVGICPLTPTEFNLTKSNNKWVEYTSVGTAVIASGNMIYNDSCADDCGVLAFELQDWIDGLDRLFTDDAERVAMVQRAQAKMESTYGIGAHRRQILDVIDLASQAKKVRRVAQCDQVKEEA